MQAWLVDAFADDRNAGNPAAVVVAEAGFPPTERMQRFAFELGVPTTAFVVPVAEQEYRLRWFTPLAELNLCGHATLASAAYLYGTGSGGLSSTAQGTLSFRTRSGTLQAAQDGREIVLDLPVIDTVAVPTPADALVALGAPVLSCERAVDDYIYELESAQAVLSLRPDFPALARMQCRGHVVTAPGDGGGIDFVSRSFFPALGVDEDQVCVSAHCKLGPFWQRRTGKARMTAEQLSPRGGRLGVQVSGGRVRVSGQARVRQMIGGLE